MPRFNRRGQEKVFLVPTIADPGAPTVAEITAGVELTPVIRSLSGFTSTQEDLDAADMSSTWGKTIPGGESTVESSMELYAGDTNADTEETVRAALVEGANRFVVFCPKGTPVATDKVNVFPVRIKAVNDNESAENAAATYTAGFALYDPPDKRVAVAA